MPRFFAYSRCSHRDSADSGAGLQAQDQKNRELFEDARALCPDLEWADQSFAHEMPGHFCDRVISAWKVPFFKRPAGAALWSHVRKGDHVAVAKVDRLFRSVADMGLTISAFEKAGVTISFGDIPMNTSTAIGKMTLGILVTLAQWESDIKSARNKEANAIRLAKPPAEAKALRAPGELEKHTYPQHGHTLSDPRIFDTILRKNTAKAAAKGQQPGRVFVYIRCSHLDSVETGYGLEWQRKICLRRAEALVKQNPLLTFGGEFADEAVSAWKHRLKLRPNGKRMHDGLRDGDHVVFSRLDRAFRSIRDMSETLPDWQARGVTAHFASDQLDLSTAMGCAIVAFMAVFAELEPALTSARTREALHQLRLQGRGVSRVWGFSKAPVPGLDGCYRFVPNRRQLSLMRLVYWLKRCGMPERKIVARVEELMAKREGRRPLPAGGVSPYYAPAWFGGADWKPYLSQSQFSPRTRSGAKRVQMVKPWFMVQDVHDLQFRWPLIAKYLATKRREAREARLRGVQE